MKYKIFALLAILVLIFSFSGCGQELQRENKIPENGVITKQQLESLKQSGSLAIFKGSNDGINYSWTFLGIDIQEVSDINIKLSFKTEYEDDIKSLTEDAFVLSSENTSLLSCSPALSIETKDKYGYGSVYLYKYLTQEKSAEFITKMNVVDGFATAVMNECSGIYFISEKNLTEDTDNSGQDTNTQNTYNTIGPNQTQNNVSPSNTPDQTQNNTAINQTNGKTPPSNNSSIKPYNSPGNTPTNTPNKSQNTPADIHNSNSITNNNPSVTPSQSTSQKSKTVTITIRCDNAVKNWNKLKPELQDERFVPKNGIILEITTVEITEGETVYDVLAKICRQKRIHMEHTGNKIYNSEYIKGINNLYEFDAGDLSGWMYSVNGWFPNYGCSRYQLKDGDRIEWHYTCDLGRDLGQEWIG